MRNLMFAVTQSPNRVLFMPSVDPFDVAKIWIFKTKKKNVAKCYR